ncbi:MAG: aminotransferase class V-fold PLP-dependent enzyme [Bacteroidota bacterium]|nr:aminotransferase class V-fold PLP-dependent enzyme [Bacteroidota bacterium]
MISSKEIHQHFNQFREGVIGFDHSFIGPFGEKKIIYADWVASGRLYRPIELKMLNDIGPFVANTHTESTFTGKFMTDAYHQARANIKKYVGANSEDVIIPCGSGMTGALAKLQRILGFKLPEQLIPHLSIPPELRPVVFITHMEHHSNQTSWMETLCEVVIIPPDESGLPDLVAFEELIVKYRHKEIKIASITACSNVTGVICPYRKLASIIHRYGGLCFVDFACSAPYVKIDMHPEESGEHLDAIFFSPHKFLGGPGTPGILIFTKNLYHNKIPDIPGGGTVKWTNPWGNHAYIDSIEDREDGGTPAFLQTIKASLAMDLKEELDPTKMHIREREIFNRLFSEFGGNKKMIILAENIQNRIAAFSFFIEGLHYNLGVSLLNDLFGIQTRGGCSCAGTYGHYLFHIEKEISESICYLIDHGDHSQKPGWIRLSVHPIMDEVDVDNIVEGIHYVLKNHQKYSRDYMYNPIENNFTHRAQDKYKITEPVHLAL